ncbi:MAG: AAA family ATPase [Bacteroidia bacterium]|nr:AAA family ATPase [Bacteroidia bacterium]
MKYLRFYMAATSRNTGKTTCTLGLIAALRGMGIHAGYCKPAGQQFVVVDGNRVDKDAPVFAGQFGFRLIPELHSPVILAPGLVSRYLDDPEQFDFRTRILDAAARLEQEYDLVVYEGTGHPGVGSAIDASNADVASWLDALVILVVEAGIGKALDQIELNLSLFREKGVKPAGVIVNKAVPEKIGKIRHYLSRRLSQSGIPLLGVLPFEESLEEVTLCEVAEAVQGRLLRNLACESIRMTGIAAARSVQSSDPAALVGKILVAQADRLATLVPMLEAPARQAALPSALLVCGKAEFTPSLEAFFKRTRMPVISSQMDSLDAAIALQQIEVKHRAADSRRTERAIELFRAHVSLDALRMAAPDALAGAPA